jgi:hypothetical protein
MDFILFLSEKLGLNIVSLLIVGLLLIVWKLVNKLATNHLFHLDLKINGLCDKLNKTHEKVEELSERISRVEGKIDS